MKMFAIIGCPFVERSKIFISYQNISDKIKFENIDLSNPPAALLNVNPNGSVPTLLFDDGSGFGESLLIIEYLDATLVPPEKRLYGPTEASRAALKAQTGLVENRFLAALQKALYSKGFYNAKLEAKVEIKKAYAFFEDFLEKNDSIFKKNETTIFDVMLAPFVLRFEALTKIDPEFELPVAKSLVGLFFERVKNNPHVQNVCIKGEDLVKAAKHFGVSSDSLQTVIDAPRSLVEKPDVNELNKTGQWVIQQGAKGPNLFTKLEFASWQAAAVAFKKLQDVCDTVDHHVDLNIKNMTSFEISLCTHEPKWGVSEKDFALARVLPSLI